MARPAARHELRPELEDEAEDVGDDLHDGRRLRVEQTPAQKHRGQFHSLIQRFTLKVLTQVWGFCDASGVVKVKQSEGTSCGLYLSVHLKRRPSPLLRCPLLI